MSYASLLRLLDQCPDVPPAEWAKYFGFEWKEARSDHSRTHLEPAGKERTQLEQDSPGNNRFQIQEPITPCFWYLQQLTRRNTKPALPAVASLAPSRSGRPVEVMVDYFEPTAFWRAELDRLLGCSIESDDPDIDRCVQQVSRYEPLISIPLKQHRSYAAGTMILVDRSPAFEPLYAWQLQVLGLITARVGMQMTDCVSLPTAPFDSQSREALLSQSAAYPRVVLLLSLDERWSDNKHRLAWQTLVAKLKEQGHEVCVLEPIMAVVDEHIVEWLMACAVDLVYPKRHSIVALAIALGGGLAEAMAAWNHHAMSYPSHIFQIKKSFRQYYRSQYSDIPQQLLPRILNVIADHRSLKFPCQITMESLVCAAGGKESLPDGAWLEELVKTLEATRPEARHAYINGLSNEYEEIHQAFSNRSELQLFFQLLDQVRPEPSVEEPTTDKVSLTGQQNGLQLAAGISPGAIITTTGPLFERDGQTLTVGLHRGTQTRHLLSMDHQFSVASLTKPAWAERIYRHANGRLCAIHQSGIRFELKAASLDNPTSDWQTNGPIWNWSSDAGIDEYGLWAELSVDRVAYRLRWIPPGTFMMGSPEAESSRQDDEQLHEVILTQGYWLGETTVTQSFWTALMEKNTSIDVEKHVPVTDVSWEDCLEFIKKLAKQFDTLDARFPTEAEWEYACRAGTSTAYWWGNTWSDDHGNVGSDVVAEQPYPSNAFGLKSMHGNVFEWCQDRYGGYSTGPVVDPKGPTEGQFRVLRGGGWLYEPQFLRAAIRIHRTPDYRFRNFGLRLAGGCDPQAGSGRGAARSADRDEGTEEQGGARGSPSKGKDA